MIKNFTIYGERCSGTNYLEKVMKLNFDNCPITWNYGWKHFFGFDDYKLDNAENTLFICIVRDPVDWINSFYRQMWHLPLKYNRTLIESAKMKKFLHGEFWSFDDNNGNKDTSKEIMEDRHLQTKNRYKNIFELRYTKLKYLMEELPRKVNHFIFIRYEDLTNDFENTMTRIKKKGLSVKPGISFPQNYYLNAKSKKKYTKTTNNKYLTRKILEHADFDVDFEKTIGYSF